MKEDFLIQCEADCERVAAVLVKWLKDNNNEMLTRTHTIQSPNEMWAVMFESIYSDEIVTHDLQEEATKNCINLTFHVEAIDPIQDTLSDMSDEELLDALGEFLADREDDDDLDEEEEDNTDD